MGKNTRMVIITVKMSHVKVVHVFNCFKINKLLHHIFQSSEKLKDINERVKKGYPGASAKKRLNMDEV